MAYSGFEPWTTSWKVVTLQSLLTWTTKKCPLAVVLISKSAFARDLTHSGDLPTSQLTTCTNLCSRSMNTT